MIARLADHCQASCLVAAVGLSLFVWPSASADSLKPRLRRPIALRLSTDERVLYTANHRSGSISAVDLARRGAWPFALRT